MEGRGHGRGERVTAVDFQGYQESRRTRGNDEALGGGRTGVSAALLARTLLPFVPFACGGTK